MQKTTRLLLITLILSALLLAACSKSDQPAATLEAYWKAMAAKDNATLSSLTCPDYEAAALSTLDSFQSVELTLKEVKCTTASSSGADAEVTCQGSLEASYGAEVSSFDLSLNTYLVKQEAGNWLMCGEK